MPGTRRGFTLLELLAVLAIIAVLTGLGMGGYRLARRTAKESRAAAEIELLRTALNEYRVQHGRFPLQPVAAALADLPEAAELASLAEGVEWTDPWGNPYLYRCTHRFQCSVWSTGQDAADPADDINPSQTGY